MISNSRSFLMSMRGKKSQPQSPNPGCNNSSSPNRPSPTRRPRREPPPTYQEAITTDRRPDGDVGAEDSSAPSRPLVGNPSTKEDPYAFLGSFDTVFLVDDSGSMAGRSWRETGSALRVIAPICTAHDANGVDVYFLNSRNTRAGAAGGKAGGFAGVTSPAAVEELFAGVRPSGGTPMGTRIQAILGPYVTAFEQAVAACGGDADATSIKPVNLIVVTDGVPTDDPESVLVRLARRLDRANAPPYQVGVQFFQVGNEPGAREALVELDDGLAEQVGGVRDMVDTTTWDGRSPHVLTGEGILKAVLGAVVKRLDRRRISLTQNRPVEAAVAA